MTDSPTVLAEAPDLVLRSALARLRLEGAIFFRSELSEPYAFASSPRAFLRALHPTAERLILFHIVASGRCWVRADCPESGERHWAGPGDVIVLPYGDAYSMGGESPAECVPLERLMDAPAPWTEMPELRHGGGGARTEIVCGYLVSDDPLFDPALRVFPPAFVVRPPGGAAAEWVSASIAYALETRSLVSTRLPELVLTEVLRLHLASAPAADHGWMAALRDPVLAPALAVLHRAPDRRWTVASLASAAAVSRSLLDDRFRTVLGVSPIRYVTEWRMHLADELLATSDMGVAAVGRRVGYDSEEAFSRAFKRARGLSPSNWRSSRR
jgi:AraC-like DNA-binding protein